MVRCGRLIVYSALTWANCAKLPSRSRECPRGVVGDKNILRTNLRQAAEKNFQSVASFSSERTKFCGVLLIEPLSAVFCEIEKWLMSHKSETIWENSRNTWAKAVNQPAEVSGKNIWTQTLVTITWGVNCLVQSSYPRTEHFFNRWVLNIWSFCLLGLQKKKRKSQNTLEFCLTCRDKPRYLVHTVSCRQTKLVIEARGDKQNIQILFIECR